MRINTGRKRFKIQETAGSSEKMISYHINTRRQNNEGKDLS